MTALAFVDTETTGLDPDRHEVWEVALRLRVPPDADGKAPADVVRHWFLPVDLAVADPVALTIGGYYARFERPEPPAPRQGRRASQSVWPDEQILEDFAAEFARLTHGAHIVAACPSFDDGFLKRLLRRNGACPGWHYHLIDVEALAAGALGLEPPWDSDHLNLLLGIDVEGKHTAEGDVAWSVAMYDAALDLSRRVRVGDLAPPTERLAAPTVTDRARFGELVDHWGMLGTVLEACTMNRERAFDEERAYFADAEAVLAAALSHVRGEFAVRSPRLPADAG